MELERPAWEEIAEFEHDAEESETGGGSRSRLPWDVVTEDEDRVPAASEAEGAEAESEGLSFYGLPPAFGMLEQEYEDTTLVGSVKELLAKGYWSAAVTFAILTGERDRNKLANMVFWARHPELDGKKIPAGNTKLAAEWKAIYATLVLPPLGPVSPSTVAPTAVPSDQKSVENLIVDIFNSEQQVLTAWSGALTQFQIVMNAHSDAEGVADFVGAVMKDVGDLVINKIAGQAPGLSYAKGLLDTVTKEYERAREARTSAQLRDFLVRFTGALTDAMNNLGRGYGDYKQMVETAYSKAGPDEKKQYQKALAEYLDSLDRSWTNVGNVFLLICQDWIRNTTWQKSRTWTTPGTSTAPAFVIISVNRDYSIRNVQLSCQGGQQIAEQLLKNGGGAGLRPYAWAVPRRILYFTDSSWPSATIHLTSDGRLLQDESQNPSVGRVVLERIRTSGLDPTTKMEGG